MKPDRLNWRTLMSAAPDTPAETISALDSYFAPFAQPPGETDEYDGQFRIEKGQPCLKCEKPLMGLTAMFFGGGFTWGLVHGEGRCSACGWPARMYHFIKDKDGKDFATIRGLCLQYHPDDVIERKKSSAA